MRLLFIMFLFSCPFLVNAQLAWKPVDTAFGLLPASIHVYYTESRMDTAPFKAYYVIADLKDKKLEFTTDTTHKRRLSPSQFYGKNNEPLVVVNGTFFSFETNANLNVVIKDGKPAAYNLKTIKSPTDTSKRLPLYSSAIGITKKRKADVAWIKTDSTTGRVEAVQFPYTATGNFYTIKQNKSTGQKTNNTNTSYNPFSQWKMQTAIGGGPVLIQAGEIKITNEEEKMFAGRAINDKHPRTAMGYTKDGKLIILAVEGRNPSASGATLVQLAHILKDLGCVEALNLDGGGSSCLLVNGKETIAPSDKKQRAIPAVFIIDKKN